MTGRIFHLNETGEATPMEEQPYDAEKVLQQLLAEHPDLLAGDQINSSDPRRWLLVTREMGVPGEEGGSAKWSLDHLFLDQDGIPTLVEVKRSTDTRLRREVVGQMLDYAANAVAYWPVEDIRAKFESQCEETGADPDEELATLVGDDESGDFWQKVRTNLQTGKIRMVFVADAVPQELRRVVEFLNEQMNPGEVLAVEVKQYVGEGMKTLVPRVIGQTETARQKKGTGEQGGGQWDEASFMADLQKHKGEPSVEAARDILQWITPRVTQVRWGTGKKLGGIVPILKVGSIQYHLIRMGSDGWFVFRFDWLKNKPPFDEEAVRRELLAKINEIPNVHFDDDVITKRARVPMDTLTNEGSFEQAKSIIEWMIGRIEGHGVERT
jgi:hypothetical protein